MRRKRERKLFREIKKMHLNEIEIYLEPDTDKLNTDELDTDKLDTDESNTDKSDTDELGTNEN
jgi:hypothetical protein